MAARARKPGNEWLQDFPGLYLNEHGVFFVVHPKTGRRSTLETKNRSMAIRRWTLIHEQWERELHNWRSEQLANRLSALSVPLDPAGQISLSEYLHTWRTEVLGHSIVDGRVVWGECKVFAIRGPHQGQPIALPTRRDYATDCQQLEASDDAKFPLSAQDAVQKIRKLLSPWLTKPTHYNGLRNTLNRVYMHAVDDGIVQRNPVVDVRKAVIPKRQVLVPDDAYKAITERLCIHKHNRRIMDGTWRAKACDLIYMMSQQPIDVLTIKESQGEIFPEPRLVDDELAYGVIRFSRHKTMVGIDLYMNEELAELWQWFLDFKKDQQIISPYLLANPRYFDKRSRASYIRHRTLQSAWRKACREAGYGDLYRLQDLRKKGLTQEFLNQGENDKGGHESEAMRNHYRLVKPPKRARSTIKILRENAKKDGSN
ncbi:hypothetical protein GCM10011533_22870 [Streptosporangium jomthongense]|uniref:Integrase n=1 Tax=Marinobacter aromaticivorans TaxID=1494078 RepID=A0ABW2IVW6_9GAMM|nr:hypothetical protein [Marinobacter aromaticivorans]GGE69924.1 hypothetical protein GCM10011533_22870 [Streptosporangium jomthongense]